MLTLLKRLNHLANEKLLRINNLYWKSSNALIILHAEVKRVLGKYVVKKKALCLDIGAGAQPYKEILDQYTSNYLSIDMSATRSKVSIVGDAMQLPVTEETVDLVFCSQVLEHVPQPWKGFNEIARVLKPKGLAFVSLPHLAYIHNAPHDYFRFTSYGITSLAESSGLDVEEIIPIGGFFCFCGYLRSTVLLPIFPMPMFGILLLYFNYWLSLLEIWLDKNLKTYKVLPANYLAVLRKNTDVK